MYSPWLQEQKGCDLFNNIVQTAQQAVVVDLNICHVNTQLFLGGSSEGQVLTPSVVVLWVTGPSGRVRHSSEAYCPTKLFPRDCPAASRLRAAHTVTQITLHSLVMVHIVQQKWWYHFCLYRDSEYLPTQGQTSYGDGEWLVMSLTLVCVHMLLWVYSWIKAQNILHRVCSNLQRPTGIRSKM